MADIKKIKDKITSTIYPNDRGAINANDHQAMLLEMADGMAETDTKVTKLLEEVVYAEDTNINLGEAFNAIPSILRKGMIIESIGSASQIILRKEDGSEFRVNSHELPYVLPFTVYSIITTTNASGSVMVVKNVLDSKLEVLSKDIQNIQNITIDGFTISLADKYYNPIILSYPLRKGMIIESIADAIGVYLRNKDGVETLFRQDNFPHTLTEDVYAIIPISEATGNMIVKSYVDSKIESLEAKHTKDVSALNESISELSANVNDVKIPLGAAWENISVSIKQGLIIESIGNALGVYLKHQDADDTYVVAYNLPYTIETDVYAIIPVSDATGSNMLIKGLLPSEMASLSKKIQSISDIQDITTEGVTISLADKYYNPIILSNPLRKGMIIESIADAIGVYLRNKDGVETLFRQDNFPHTLTEDVYAIIPISEATGNMVVKSYVDSKIESLEATSGGGKTDLSNESHIAIPLPTSLVKVNILASRFPTSKGDNISGFIEFYDRNGNFFRKPIESIALQGSTSLGAPKKNIKFDFSDCTMKIGNWVTQDSYHLKSNYFDVFRGKSNLAYDLWRNIIEFNRPKTFRTPYINSSQYSWYEGVDDVNNDFNEARLTPAGFPIELYYNGDYYGIYTWNIKKDRANYAMDKKKANNIHIDPSHIDTLLNGESVIWGEFEIRNPKSLITMVGGEYDGDNPTELIDSSSSAYDGSNADHKRSAEVKASIIAFKDACAEINAKKDKTTFEKYFDKDWMIDFIIWGNVILDGDGLSRNTQYLYWGDKWYPTPYDCDQIYGNSWRGNLIYRKLRRIVDSSILGQGVGIYDTFLSLYATDIEARYKELREANVISSNTIIAQISQYVDLIGKEAFAREFELWDETPSYRKPNDNPQWKYEGDYYEGNISEWNESSSYKVGDYVYIIVEGDRYYWRCLKANTGVRPYTDKYVNTPIVGGIFDSVTRTEKWLTARFSFLDNYYNL